MLVRVAVTHGWVVLALVCSASAGCTRVVPYFTNEFGETGASGDGDGDGDGDPWSGDGDGETEPQPTTEMPPPDLPEDTWCFLPEAIGCPSPDDKCVPDYFEGDFECVPIFGPAQPGELCMWDEFSNWDNCDGDSYCFNGVCHPFCNEQGSCSSGGLCREDTWLCLDPCDPLAQDCAPGLGCVYLSWAEQFTCEPMDPGGPQDGEPCESFDPAQGCAPGHLCVPADQTSPCGSEEGCCSAFCDLSLGDEACAAAVGDTCVPLDIPAAPELGVCVGPPEGTVEAGALAFVEVQPQGPGVPINEGPYEYIELINLSDGDIELGALVLDDFVGAFGQIINQNFVADGGEGGCAGGTPLCLGPGRRALFVGLTYAGETGDALVLRSSTVNLLGTLLQPWTRIELLDSQDNHISTYRNWDDPGGEPLPVEEMSMHRIDPLGPDEPLNWESAPTSPGL